MSVTMGTTDRSPTLDESWTSRAACAGGAGRSGVSAGADPDAMFVQGAAQRDARLVCFACPVRMECLLEAFETGMEFGVWGGLTERERRAMVRQAAGSGVPWRQRLLYDSGAAGAVRAGTSAGGRAGRGPGHAPSRGAVTCGPGSDAQRAVRSCPSLSA